MRCTGTGTTPSSRLTMLALTTTCSIAIGCKSAERWGKGDITERERVWGCGVGALSLTRGTFQAHPGSWGGIVVIEWGSNGMHA